jgi:hypothetical protein
MILIDDLLIVLIAFLFVALNLQSQNVLVLKVQQQMQQRLMDVGV